MKFISGILNFFTSLTFENILDIEIGLIIIVFFKIFSSFFAYVLVKIFNFKVKDKKLIKKNCFYKPLNSFFVVLGFYIGFMSLKLPENVFAIITKLFRICIILLVTKGFADLFNPTSATFSKLGQKFHFNQNDTTINFFSKIAKALIFIISGFILISELGYNLGGLATGLGISSVVIALAAQDVAKSFLAGISIISDKPFEIGDYILVNSFEGTVEDITFRTTRIRDTENQIIVLPNSILTSTNIINSTKREKRRFYLLLTLEIDTPLEKISDLIEKFKFSLTNYPNIIKDSIKIFFDTISSDGINLSIDFYTNLTDYVEFMKFKEQINYTLLEITHKSNVNLLQPICLKKS
ncbi:MAG: mechanosensitive ion channel family protein [Clostridia bacterium]|nr:mechanosensitive ion channel family protein [Clostridia bacterium]